MLCFHLTAAEAPRRIQSAIKDTELYTLQGNTKLMLALAQDGGEVSDARPLLRMAVHFTLTAQQQADLQQLLRQQQTRGTAQFHKFLTPEEYGARFGPNAQDIAGVSAWLKAQGFSNVQVARSRMFISFEGNAGQAKSAFNTSIHSYTIDGESHFANSSDPQLPMALQGLVQSIRGLNDFRMKPKGVRRLRPRFTSNISGNHYLAPGDLATMYDLSPLYQAGFDGTGVRIATVGQSDIQLSDVEAFRAAAGLAPKDPQVILVGADPGLAQASGDELESDLDVEWAGAMARNATILFVTSTDVSTSISYVIDNNLAPILTLSYGLCEADTGLAETNTQAAEYMQANAQGMTVIASAGDGGAADCDSGYPARHGFAVDVPASLASVTGVGGTTLADGTGTYWSATNDAFGGSALSYIPETAWNDSSSANGLSAGGGGASMYVPKPAWQTGTGVPNDGLRDVPDLALAASPDHDGYLVCSNGDCVSGFRNTDTTLDVVGGTSIGSPTFASMLALLVQTQGPQGNINPDLYALAASTPAAFHDVTAGNNIVACQVGSTQCGTGSLGYAAGVGYDQATGLGSIDAAQLFAAWKSLTAAAIPASEGPLSFVPVTPCRVADTRNGPGAFGGPELAAGSTREFDIPNSTCNIPAAAVAYALNMTVVPDGPLTYLSTWPSGKSRPLVSTLNSDGRIKATAAIVPAGVNGGVDVYVTDSTNLVMDISGYFVASAAASGLQFFPVAPCRIADTRSSAGSLGGPYLAGGQIRAFPVLSAGCSVPASAQAYSLNFTVVPRSSLLFITAWPAGAAQPLASVLNAPTGTTTANAAIINAGAGGGISTYASSDTDLVIDIDGYFAPAATGGDYFYTLSPCRVEDTRNPAGTAPASGASPFNVSNSGCGAPVSARAFVLNATVVPTGPLAYLTLWPDQQPQPFVSTLNADPSTVTSNMAIVPSTNGAIDAFSTGLTYLIFDISGYFAP